MRVIATSIIMLTTSAAPCCLMPDDMDIDVGMRFNNCVGLLSWNRVVGGSGRSRYKRCRPTKTQKCCCPDCNPFRDTRTALAPRLAPRLPETNWVLLEHR